MCDWSKFPLLCNHCMLGRTYSVRLLYSEALPLLPLLLLFAQKGRLRLQAGASAKPESSRRGCLWARRTVRAHSFQEKRLSKAIAERAPVVEGSSGVSARKAIASTCLSVLVYTTPTSLCRLSTNDLLARSFFGSLVRYLQHT